MPVYHVDVHREVQKQIDRFSASVQDRLEQAIRALAGNPRPPRRSRQLSGTARRLRIEDYRVIYEVDDDEREILVLEIWHRQRGYR